MRGHARFLLAIALLFSSLYIVRLRSALPLAAYRGGIASFPRWTDDDDNAASLPGLGATTATVAHEAATLGGSIPRRARLSMENPQLKAYAQMLETQHLHAREQRVRNGPIPGAGVAVGATPGGGGSDAQPQSDPSHHRLAHLPWHARPWVAVARQWRAGKGGRRHGDRGGGHGHLAGAPLLQRCLVPLLQACGVVGKMRHDELVQSGSSNKDVPMAGGKASRMAPAARLAMYKVLWYSEGSLTGTWADIEAAVNQAVADGVDVISILLGGMDNMEIYFDHMPYLSANLDPCYFRTIDNFSPFYLTVGASTIGRGGLTLKATTPAAAALSNSSSSSATAYPSIADFSSTGPLCDPATRATGALPTNSILKPDIVCPGVDLYAAAPGAKVGKPGSFAQMSGTSMATPHLAGIAALIMQKHAKWSPAQVMSAIMTAAKTTDTSGAAIKNGGGEVAIVGYGRWSRVPTQGAGP
ncbi:unnamed protein product [Closterium sp. Naga37s-1]|nr:unnamed protein product [Closterium sp. Naga37s-1]